MKSSRRASRRALFLFPALALAMAFSSFSRAEEAGPLLLENAFQLKAYYYAYSSAALEEKEFTRYVGDEPEEGATTEAALHSKVAEAIELAKSHPKVVLDLKQISLHAYDASKKAFPMDNRLFLSGVSYYFDVSPFHYRYSGGWGTNLMPCTDSRTIATINAMIKGYRQFGMRIFGTVESANTGDNSIVIRLERVRLLDDHGAVLFEKKVGG